jgi:hypothetical protein
MRDLDLPRGDERQLVVDRDRVYELEGEDSRTLAAVVGAFRVGNRFNRTAATAPLFNYLAPDRSAKEKVVSQTFASWNRIAEWLSRLEGLRGPA